MPITMYDREGNAHAVEESEALSLYKSGQLGFAEGTNVPITDDAGTVNVQDISQIADTLNPDIQRIESPEETKQRILQEQYGGLGQQALTGVETGLSSATLGASDVIATGIGGNDYRTARESREEANPKAAAIGTVAGLALPVLASGGTSLAARGASTIGAGARFAAEAGGLAERGAGALLRGVGVTGEGVLSRALVRGVELGATGAVEGGIYGAGHALSETALAPDGDYDHLASRLYAGLKEGAETGAITGFGLGAGLGAGSAALEKVLANPNVKGLAGKLRDEAVLKAINPTKRLARELGGAERKAAVVDNLINDDIVGMSSKGIVRSKGEMLERAGEVLDQRGNEIGNLLKKVDDAGVKPDMQKILGEVEDLKSKFGKSLDPEVAKIANRIEDRISLVRQGEDLTFKDLHQFRRSIDDHVNWATEPKGKDLQSAWRDLRGIFERNIEGQAEKNLPGQFLKEYKQAKESFSAASFAQKALKDNLLKGQTNRFLGLSEHVLGAGALAGGLAKAGTLGGVAGLVGGAVTSKVLREYGPSAAAVLLNRVARTENRISLRLSHFLEHAESTGKASVFGKEVSHQTVKQIKAVAESTRIASAETAAKKIEAVRGHEAEATEKYHEKLDEIGRSTDPENLERKIGTMASHAPRTTTAFVGRAVRAAAYLKSQAPTSQIDTEALQPNLEKPRPDPVALAKWNRKVATVENPLSVLDRLNDGTLTKDHVEALKAVDPGLYQDIQTTVISKIANMKRPLEYDKRIKLGLLLGIPADKSLRPASIQASQSIYAPANPPPEPATPAAQSKNIEEHIRNVSSTSNSLESQDWEVN